MMYRTRYLLTVLCGLLLLAGVGRAEAQAIGWNNFSGGENWIDFAGWNTVPLPDPFYYEGCTFYELGNDLSQNGWSPMDWTYCFQDGSAAFPGLSLGYGMADNREQTVIKVEFTDYSDIRRVGILASSGGVGNTFRLEAFDLWGYSLGYVEATLTAECDPVWLGIESAFEIGHIMLTEPSGPDLYRGIFDDLRFESSDLIFLNGFEPGNTSAWSDVVP